jgi:hypothetical protein
VKLILTYANLQAMIVLINRPTLRLMKIIVEGKENNFIINLIKNRSKNDFLNNNHNYSRQ